MQDGVLNAANVLVHRRPILCALSHHRIRVGRVAITHEVPRRIHERVHGVSLAASGFATGRTHHAFVKTFMLVQRVPRTIGNTVQRQDHGQVFFGHGHSTVLIAMDDGNRRAPIALAADTPIAQTPSGFLFAEAFGCQKLSYFVSRSFLGQTIQLARVHTHTRLSGIPIVPNRHIERRRTASQQGGISRCAGCRFGACV